MLTWLVPNRVPARSDEGQSISGNGSNMEEHLEPLMELGGHSPVSWPFKKPLNPDAFQSEAPSTPQCPEVYTVTYSWNASDRHHLFFQDGITVPCKDEEWRSAQLQSKEESNSSVVKNSLEAEQ